MNKTFSKTRIFYYDNEPSLLKIDDTTDMRIEVPEITSSYPFLSVRIPGDKHNWSYIPINAYGLYCTFGELQTLVENCDTYQPESLSVVVGHTIPLARYPSTANSTQLSFNNTIYSLIAVNEDNYIGINSYVSQAEVNSIVRTFDGVSAVDASTRTELPKRPMFFRIPYHSLPTTAVNAPVNQATRLVNDGSSTSEAVPATAATRLEYNQTLVQLIDSYIPELLQNNDNVYTLYPGENQFTKDFNTFEPRYSAIDTSGPSFNETVWQLDQRMNTLINRDITGRAPNAILALPLQMNIRGNNSDSLPDNLAFGDTTALAVNNFNKFADIYFNRDGTNDYTTSLPKIFIKGVPIVDGTNNLVPHTFCCTITWTLNLKCTPRSDAEINRLQWRMTYPYLRAFQLEDGTITAHYYNQSNFAKKPYRHNIFKRTPYMRFMNITEAQQQTFDRAALKNLHRDRAGPLTQIPDITTGAPDNIAPSTFGTTLPYGAGWYEGHAFARNAAVPT